MTAPASAPARPRRGQPRRAESRSAARDGLNVRRHAHTRDLRTYVAFLWFTRRRRDRRDASMDHRAAFEWRRRRDERGPRSEEASWDREVSTVNDFYPWAGRRQGRSHPSARGLQCGRRGGTGLAARWCGKCRPRHYATLVDVRFRPRIPAPARPATPTEPSGVDVRTEANLSRPRKENTDLRALWLCTRRPSAGRLSKSAPAQRRHRSSTANRSRPAPPGPPESDTPRRLACERTSGVARSRLSMVKESPAGQRTRSRGVALMTELGQFGGGGQALYDPVSASGASGTGPATIPAAPGPTRPADRPGARWKERRRPRRQGQQRGRRVALPGYHDRADRRPVAGPQALLVVVTDGVAGAHVFDARAARISRPGRRVAAVDTVGAGSAAGRRRTPPRSRRMRLPRPAAPAAGVRPAGFSRTDQASATAPKPCRRYSSRN